MRIKCRIALAVDGRGEWRARGYHYNVPVDMATFIGYPIEGERRYWVEVEVEAPEPSEVQTVKGEAKEAT